MQICGDEGSRVYSQLMIQRSMDGYSTTKEKSELVKVLKKIRETIPEDNSKKNDSDESMKDDGDDKRDDKESESWTFCTFLVFIFIVLFRNAVVIIITVHL